MGFEWQMTVVTEHSHNTGSNVMFGTKRPSMMSYWMRSTPRR